MKKKIFGLILATMVFGAVCAGCSEKKTDTPEAKDVEVIATSEENADIGQDENTNNEPEDADNGQGETKAIEKKKFVLVKKTQHSRDYDDTYVSDFEYDEYGNELSCVEYLKNGEVSATLKSEYDDHGNLIKTERFVDDVKVVEAVYSYDKDDRLIEMAATSVLSGNTQKRYDYEYDSEGKLLRFWMDPGTGDSLYRTEHVYNDLGQIVEINTYAEYDSGEVFWIQHHTREYDADGNVIKEENYTVENPDGGEPQLGDITSTIEYEYRAFE